MVPANRTQTQRRTNPQTVHRMPGTAPTTATGPADGPESELDRCARGRRVNGKAPTEAAPHVAPHPAAPQPDDDSSAAGVVNGATPGHDEGPHHPGGAGDAAAAGLDGEEGHD